MMRIVLMALVTSLAVSAHAQTSIRMYAAENLRPAIDEMAAAYTSARVEAQYGSSGLLRDRIAAGERPALFASANVEHPHSLTREGLAGPVKRFARDRNAEYGLVLVDGAGEEAWYFAQFVLSADGQAILAKHGFSPGASARVAAK
jgi:ABC-type molybdate transport system substrate-binding protein